MRDINRIKPILEELEKYWLNTPDLRLCQILWNFKPNNFEDNYNIEDSFIYKKLLEENNG